MSIVRETGSEKAFPARSPIWGIVKIMVPFWVPIIIRGLIRGLIYGTQEGTIILTIPDLWAAHPERQGDQRQAL